MAERCKPCEIYRRIYDVYGEVGFSKKKKNVYKWAKLLKEGWNSIQDDGRLTLACTPEMVDSVNAHILADRSYNRGGYFWTTWNFYGYTVHKILHDGLVISKVSCCGFHLDNAKPHTTARIVEAISCHTL